jgi:RNA-binding protein YlmH
MIEEDELLKKRLKELADKAWQNNMYTFTGFLSLSDMACFYEIEKELSFIPVVIFGGNRDAERVMLRFGSQELFGYEEDFPITCLKIRPLMQKFADKLSHRDFLGALMNLGIERSTLGDIILKDNEGYLFCTTAIAGYIRENLDKIKHTSVLCEETTDIPEVKEEDLTEIKIQIPSERIDAVVAKVYKLTRSDSSVLFGQKKVFVNGRLCENSSRMLKSQDCVSVRGYGKFIFTEKQGISKKGKLNVSVLVYGRG